MRVVGIQIGPYKSYLYLDCLLTLLDSSAFTCKIFRLEVIGNYDFLPSSALSSRVRNGLFVKGHRELVSRYKNVAVSISKKYW